MRAQHDRLAVNRAACFSKVRLPAVLKWPALTVVTTIDRYARCSLRAASTLVSRVNGIAAVIAAIEITTSDAANIINGSSPEIPKTTLLSQCDPENPAITPKAIPRTINFDACMPAQERIVDRRAPSP